VSIFGEAQSWAAALAPQLCS